MTKDTLKGFIFGAVLMLMTPALAIPAEPPAAGLAPAEKQLPEDTAPYFRLGYGDAEGAIGAALSERGAGGKISASITTRDGDYIFSYGQPIAVEIRGLKFDRQTHRFSANLVALSGKEVVSAKAVGGRFDEMVEVPVLKRSVRAGETIAAADIELRDYPQARARADTITDMASLIGKSPERVISPGRPIREQEIAEAALVHKNDLVKMVFRRGSMEISTTGQVIDEGHKGSVISVKNLASKKIIQAVVQDSETVMIGGTEKQTAQAGTVYE